MSFEIKNPRMCKCGHNEIQHYEYFDTSIADGLVGRKLGRCSACLTCTEFAEEDMTTNRFIVCCSGDVDSLRGDYPSTRRNPQDVYMMSGFRKKYTFENATAEAEKLAAKFPEAKFYVAEIKTVSTVSKPVVTREVI